MDLSTLSYWSAHPSIGTGSSPPTQKAAGSSGEASRLPRDLP